jgi:hypothetical protein
LVTDPHVISRAVYPPGPVQFVMSANVSHRTDCALTGEAITKRARAARSGGFIVLLAA